MEERQQIETELSAWRRFWRIVCFLAFVGLVLFMWSLTPGCVPLSTYQPVCRHQAILAATTLRDLGIPVRIAVGPTGKPGIYHAQAQALLNGEWVWLQAWSRVETGEMERVFTVERFVEIEEAQEWR